MEPNEFLDKFNSDVEEDNSIASMTDFSSTDSIDLVSIPEAPLNFDELINTSSEAIDILPIDFDLPSPMDLEIPSPIDLDFGLDVPIDFTEVISETPIVSTGEKRQEEYIVPFGSYSVSLHSPATDKLKLYENKVSNIELDFLSWLVNNDYEIVDSYNVVLDSWNHNFPKHLLTNSSDVLELYLQNEYNLFAPKNILEMLFKANILLIKEFAHPHRMLTLKDINTIRNNYGNPKFNLDLYKRFSVDEDSIDNLTALMLSDSFDINEAENYASNILQFNSYLTLKVAGLFEKSEFDEAIKAGTDLTQYVNNLIKGIRHYPEVSTRSDYAQLQKVLNEYEKETCRSVKPLLESFSKYEGLYYIVKAGMSGIYSSRFAHKYLATLDYPYSSKISYWFSTNCILSEESLEAIDVDFYKAYIYQILVMDFGYKSEFSKDFVSNPINHKLITLLVNAMFDGKMIDYNLMQYLYHLTTNNKYLNSKDLLNIVEAYNVYDYNWVILKLTTKFTPRLGIGNDIIIMLGSSAYQLYTIEDLLNDNPRLSKCLEMAERLEEIDGNRGLAVYTPVDGKRAYKDRVVIPPFSNTSLANWAINRSNNIETYNLKLEEAIPRFNLLLLIHNLKSHGRVCHQLVIDYLTNSYDEYIKFDKIFGSLATYKFELSSIVTLPECLVLLTVYRGACLSSTPAIEVYTVIEKVLGAFFSGKFRSERNGLTSVPSSVNYVFPSGAGTNSDLTLANFVREFPSIKSACERATDILLKVNNDRMFLLLTTK